MFGRLFGPKVVLPWSQRGGKGRHRRGTVVTGAKHRRKQTVGGRRVTPRDDAFGLFRWR